jgi:RNA recognition motif-containing protein
MNIYVGNLPYNTGENELRSVFEEHGTVDTVKVIVDRMTARSKGFGFVEMPDEEEAKAAIDALNGKEMEGRPLKVNEARPKEERRPRF